MFQQLFSYSFDEQKAITQGALLPYLNIWNEKHRDEHPHLSTDLPLMKLKVQEPTSSALPDELDPADAEFWNALLGYFDGISENNEPVQRIKHFATAIRSSVLAVQINQWIRDFPGQYQHWRRGEIVSGPTFLDDKVAADKAEKAWERIDFLFSHGRKTRAPPEITMNNIENAFREWEQSLL
jgi:hypothetical protein